MARAKKTACRPTSSIERDVRATRARVRPNLPICASESDSVTSITPPSIGCRPR